MTTRWQRWRRRLTGPFGRRVLLALGLAAAWGWWLYVPPWPLRVWRLPEGDVAPDLPVITGPPALRPRHSRSGLAVDGPWLLCGDGHGGKLLCDTANGRWAKWQPPDGPGGDRFYGYPAAISADGRVVAGARLDGEAFQVWESATGRVVATLEGARPPFAFTPDGRALLTATPGTSAKLWDVATGRELLDLPGHELLDLPGRLHTIAAVRVSPDGRLLVTGLRPVPPFNSRAGLVQVRLWDAGTGRLVATLDNDNSTGSSLFFPNLDFSPDGSLLVSRSPHGRGLLWDVTADPPRNRDDLLALTEHGFPLTAYQDSTSLTFAPNGHNWWIVAEGGLALARADAPTSPPRVLCRLGRGGYVGGNPVFTDDGQAFAVLALYKMPTVEQRIGDWVRETLRQPVPSHPPRSTVQMFDATTGRELATLPEGASYVDFCFTPDGRTLWTLRSERSPDGLQQVFEQWAVPPPGPPWWLLVVTALGLLLAGADWRRSRRRVATGGPTP